MIVAIDYICCSVDFDESGNDCVSLSSSLVILCTVIGKMFHKAVWKLLGKLRGKAS